MKVAYIHYLAGDSIGCTKTIELTDGRTFEDFLRTCCPGSLTFEKQGAYYLMGIRFSYGFEPTGERFKLVSVDA